MRTLTLLLALLIACASLPTAASAVDAAEENAAAAASSDGAAPEWKLRFQGDMKHHRAVWGATTLAFLGLETGYFLAGINHSPGWFQGATVNLLFIGVGLSGLITNALVSAAIDVSTDRRRMAHHFRRAGIAAMAIGSGMVTLMVVIAPPLNWAGWNPELVGLFALPAGAFVAMGVLAHWATLAEPPRFAEDYDPRRFRPRVVAAGPTSLVVTF